MSAAKAASPVLQVMRKELREMFRDKRVRNSAIFGPIIVIVGFMSLFGFVFGQIDKKENQKIHVVTTDNPLARALQKEGVQVIQVPTLQDGQRLIQQGKARILLNFSPLVPNRQEVVDAYYDPKLPAASVTLQVVQAMFAELDKQAVQATFQSLGMPGWKSEPIKVDKHEVQVGAKGGASEFLVGFLPYLIVMWGFYGGMSVATDLVAGEKEKSTLETLLITPVRRTQIVLGKFLAIGAVCLTTCFSSLFAIVLLAIIKPPGSAEMFKTGLGVTPDAAAIIVLLMIPMTALFASLLIGVSSYAKNPRESQTYLAQFSFVVILPAIFSQFIGFTDFGSSEWVNFIPILNTANNIRNALLGKEDFVAIAITVGISAVLAALALRLTIHLFNREEVIVRI